MSTVEAAPLKAEYTLPSGAWRIVILLCFVGCLNYLDRTMITTMRTSIIEAMPMSDAQFGLLTSVFLWVYGILSPFAGYLADHFNRSRVIIGSLFVWSAVTWLTSYVTTFEQLVATRILMGVSEACYLPAAVALIVDYHKTTTRSLASGIHIAGVMVGQSLGFVGGWIAEDHDWTAPFSVFGLVGIGYSFVLLWLLRDAPESNQAEEKADEPKIDFFQALRSLFGQWSFILLVVFLVFAGDYRLDGDGMDADVLQRAFQLVAGHGRALCHGLSLSRFHRRGNPGWLFIRPVCKRECQFEIPHTRDRTMHCGAEHIYREQYLGTAAGDRHVYGVWAHPYVQRREPDAHSMPDRRPALSGNRLRRTQFFCLRDRRDRFVCRRGFARHAG